MPRKGENKNGSKGYKYHLYDVGDFSIILLFLWLVYLANVVSFLGLRLCCILWVSQAVKPFFFLCLCLHVCFPLQFLFFPSFLLCSQLSPLQGRRARPIFFFYTFVCNSIYAIKDLISWTSSNQKPNNRIKLHLTKFICNDVIIFLGI